jgi:hypothetical protein
MGDLKTWGSVKVHNTIMIPNVNQSLIEELEVATQEAVKILNEQCRDPFPHLPDGIFYIHIIQGWPGIRADVRERGLHEHMAKTSSYFDGTVASSTAKNRIGQDPMNSALIVSLLSPLPPSVENAWPRWLEWRMRRRYIPEWLRAFKESRRKSETRGYCSR